MTFTKRTTCRISGEPLTELFSLGKLYVSDFLLPEDISNTEDKVELTLCLAPKSELIQLNCTADLDKMYARRYWYRSGTNNSMTNELHDIVNSVLQIMPLEQGDYWLDIGCNDGTLFKFIPEQVKKIGFDPCKENCLEARSQDAIIVNDYFNAKTFGKVASKKAKIITSIAMMYDLEDPHKFIDDIHEILDIDGIWVIQVSYLPLMLHQLAFDNICHEHLEYYTLKVLKRLLESHDFEIMDFRINDTNGGSCRLYVQHKTCNHKKFSTAPFRDVAKFRIDAALIHENTLHLSEENTYIEFFKKIQQLRQQTLGFINDIRSKGKTVWGYGASTKGNTLLQYFGMNKEHIGAIAERQAAKWGRKTIGSEIPIKSETEFRETAPDYLLILPWHFVNEFRQREHDYLMKGGKFILPCPQFEII